MLTKITFNISEEDQLNIEQIQKRHPAWLPETIFRRALAVYANNLEKPAPRSVNTTRSAQQDINELFGP